MAVNINNMPYVHRDISWLSFNYRVLQEAKDERVPLLERIKFLGIYSSNLDEFFRVRVASLKSLLHVGKKTKQQLEFAPEEVLREIRSIVRKQQLEFSEIYQKQILPALEREGIQMMRLQDLTESHIQFMNNYVEEVLIQHVQPILMVKGKIRTFLRNSSLYLTVILETEGGINRYALVRIPTDMLPRFVELPSIDKETKQILLLDDMVRHSLPSLFPGYTVVDAYSIKMTRDAELHIDDEYTGNLIDKIKKSLSKRNIGSGTRFVYDRKMPRKCLDFLMENFLIEARDLHPEGRYHNNFDFFKFPSFGKSHLKDQPMPPLGHPAFEANRNFFDVLSKQDRMVHFPYQKYDYVLRFMEQAARDPHVRSIKLTQYRVAKDSQIMSALKLALHEGKEVVVFMEVKARFDEEANISWAEKLESWGAKVLYSIPDIKVHAKLALVTRMEGKHEVDYCYLSTGNFNENTATIYGDFGFFTADNRITNEVNHVFRFLETDGKKDYSYRHLLVGQNRMRREIWKRIDAEIDNARAGKQAAITLKLNSIQDQRMIQKLYEASQAGVKIRMLVRGICCIVPQMEGFSENIEIYSIIDRFLEHTRVYMFHNGGNPSIYLSSADWMTRNLYSRIECAFPIYDPHLRNEIIDMLEMQFRDNVKSRIIEITQSNAYVERHEGEPEHRSQVELYNYYKKRLEKRQL